MDQRQFCALERKRFCLWGVNGKLWKSEMPGFPSGRLAPLCLLASVQMSPCQRGLPWQLFTKTDLPLSCPFAWLLLLMATYHHFAYLFACSLSDGQESVKTEAEMFCLHFLSVLAVLGLCCWWPSSSCGVRTEAGYLFLYPIFLSFLGCWAFVAAWQLPLAMGCGPLVQGLVVELGLLSGASVVVVHGLIAWPVGPSRTRDQTRPRR